MKAAVAFAVVGLAATLGGTALYLATRPAARPSVPPVAPADIGPAALYAATFRDADGRPVSLGRYGGKPVVLNFWATWCAPCREEMPALSRVSTRWAARVQFVGLAQDDPVKVRAFGADLAIAYPLWTGGDEVMELAARLGDRMRVLPFTVVLDSTGRVISQKVGTYTESELERHVASIAANAPDPR